jgi:hypothetical protein
MLSQEANQEFACLEKALVSRHACRARMPGERAGVLAWLHSLQRGLRSSFPNHMLGEPMTSMG